MSKSGFVDVIRKRKNLTAFGLCVAGVVLNMLLNTISKLLDLPLYLDTVGTVIAALLGGYLPGVIVGFSTNILKATLNSSSLYYGVISVLIAICATFLSGKMWHKSKTGLVGMVIVFSLIGGGLGSIIPLLIDGAPAANEALSLLISSSSGFSYIIAHIISSIIMDIPDKAITVILAIIMVRLVSEENYEYFHFTTWQQKPISSEELEKVGNIPTRGHSFQKKMLITLAASLTTVSLVALFIGVTMYKRAITNDHKRIAQGTARIAAAMIDGDKVDRYIETQGKAEGYAETKARLQDILDNSTDVCFLYVYKIKEDGCHVVFDLDAGDTPAVGIGYIVPFDESFSDRIPLLLQGKEVEPIISNDKYGYLLTAYEPVYDSSGNCACYVGADVDMYHLNTMVNSFFAEMIFVFLAFFLVIGVMVVWLARYHIIYPINSIARCMDRLTKSSDDQESMDDDVKMFRSLGIHTGDEVENLYLSACRMTKNQAEHLRSIQRLSDSTSKMQDGLIITMADLVESRDSDTGAHVQKTSAYVKIIAEGLKEKGYYAQKLTPKFISDVVRSAPLHDIGKIHIPDEILNKPGKLTEEEFEIMKSHTTAGKRIMENAISTVEGDNYLKEARNMAAYHHERWDGKGYPEGIHGEVIPLSARIMAVADVFDALTSERAYKPKFSLEEAISVLEEGKGTQFDPRCVEVFLDSLPEVKVILRKYNSVR